MILTSFDLFNLFVLCCFCVVFVIEWFLIGDDLMMFESEKARFDEIMRKLSNMNLLKMPKLELFKHEARSSANSITKEILMLKLSD